MRLLTLICSLFALALTISASPPHPISRLPEPLTHAPNAMRAAFSIPLLPALSPPSSPHPKRERDKRDENKLYTFGTYKTRKNPSTFTDLSAPFNESSGSSWCNEIPDMGKGDERNNQIISVVVNSHIGWSEPEKRPPEYVCFFYESRGICDPSKGHAEHVESVPGPKGSANETVFDTGRYKYVSWGCQWHPLNKKSTWGGTGWP